jgi:hypothetical protein
VPHAVMAGPYAVVTAVVIEVLRVVVHCCFGLPPTVVTALLIAVLQFASHGTGVLVVEATTGLAVQ